MPRSTELTQVSELQEASSGPSPTCAEFPFLPEGLGCSGAGVAIPTWGPGLFRGRGRQGLQQGHCFLFLLSSPPTPTTVELPSLPFPSLCFLSLPCLYIPMSLLSLLSSLHSLPVFIPLPPSWAHLTHFPGGHMVPDSEHLIPSWCRGSTGSHRQGRG